MIINKIEIGEEKFFEETQNKLIIYVRTGEKSELYIIIIYKDGEVYITHDYSNYKFKNSEPDLYEFIFNDSVKEFILNSKLKLIYPNKESKKVLEEFKTEFSRIVNIGN